MTEAPSLLSLCIYVIRDEILDGGDDILSFVYKLPSDLFDCLVPHLPPLALQKLQDKMPLDRCYDQDSGDDYVGVRRKRKRYANFNETWKVLYLSRWRVIQNRTMGWCVDVDPNEMMNDWQQLYWEKHLQNCLDAAAEIVSVPSFDGCLGEIKIPACAEAVVRCSDYRRHRIGGTSGWNLAKHCQQFGLHVKFLRLQNVLCVAEISDLLRECSLQGLELHWIKSKEQVEGLCHLLNQNSATLISLEFVHCKLSPAFVKAICDSLCAKDRQRHGLQHFSIKTSSFLEANSSSSPVQLASFLSSGRSLSSLILRDNQLRWNFASTVFKSLLDVSSSIAILDLSENNITGWLSNFKWRSSRHSQLSLGMSMSLQSLNSLKLRNNNLCKDDMDCLKYALVYMPNLEVLDLSDNPIEDDGIRSLFSYFKERCERETPFADLNLENCELSCDGVIQLLQVLSDLKQPLDSLSVADNDLGSQVGPPLGKFLCTGIQSVDIKRIRLGSSGFSEALKEIVGELKLVRINISNNRGGTEAAQFLSKLILAAPELVEIDAGYTCMPAESVSIICSCLKDVKGELCRLDLTGNHLLNQPAYSSLLAEFQVDGKPIVVHQSPSASDKLYDNDP